MKICVRCKLPKADFPKNRSRRDGLGSWCNDCQRDYMRGRKGDPIKRRLAAKKSAHRYPERRQAREKVKDAVRSGKLSIIKRQICVDCGAPANSYDHYLGYDHKLDVEPVCSVCHGKRSRKRGEHRRRLAGRVLDGQIHEERP